MGKNFLLIFIISVVGLGIAVYFFQNILIEQITGLTSNTFKKDTIKERAVFEDISKIKLGSGIFNVSVAESDRERKIGLSGRESLSINEGLFFVFDREGKHSIWMKNMRFAIDIIWLDKSFEVVDIKENVLPESFPEVFSPRADALYVLELKNNSSKKYDISLGKKMVIIK
jgi:uncharacterized membrane protein (UPF0127 family)